MKTSIINIESVTNPDPGCGGRDPETNEAVVARAPYTLKVYHTGKEQISIEIKDFFGYRGMA
jgi:hypothetical protein